uniref:Uncharacterized protein n=1 Tax=Coccidioides posadasii RMSCC 3488 TaxID=454284 RepID=A0A0J6F617_COCPO|nr:hypothetical protein CPAG_01072 [Coccidioides posadasii RMSCC 3488]
MAATWEANHLRYHFSTRDELLMAKFLTQKINLLNEAGITDEDHIIQYIYNSIKSQLQIACSLDEDFINEDLESYCWKLQIQKEPIFRHWSKCNKLPNAPKLAGGVLIKQKVYMVKAEQASISSTSNLENEEHDYNYLLSTDYISTSENSDSKN